MDLPEVIIKGTFASRPAANVTSPAALFIAEDTGAWYRNKNDMSAWEDVTPGAAAAKPVKYVIPTGAIDGSNATFALPDTPNAASVMVFQNGGARAPGTDFTVSGANIVLASPPYAGDSLTVGYQVA